MENNLHVMVLLWQVTEMICAERDKEVELGQMMLYNIGALNLFFFYLWYIHWLS